jgi:hypothetical protein
VQFFVEEVENLEAGSPVLYSIRPDASLHVAAISFCNH